MPDCCHAARPEIRHPGAINNESTSLRSQSGFGIAVRSRTGRSASGACETGAVTRRETVVWGKRRKCCPLRRADRAGTRNNSPASANFGTTDLCLGWVAGVNEPWSPIRSLCPFALTYWWHGHLEAVVCPLYSSNTTRAGLE